MKITICGSMKFMTEMLAAQKQLELSGHQVILPVWENLHTSESNQNNLLNKKREYIAEHIRKIVQSDAILVLNYNKNNIQNYIGGNSLIEIGIAFEHDKKIFILNPPPSETVLSYSLEIESLNPIVINGDLSLITD